MVWQSESEREETRYKGSVDLSIDGGGGVI